MKTIIYLSLFVSIILIGCVKDRPPQTDPCTPVSAKFLADVQPIINASCSNSSNCHGSGSINSGGPLTDYNKIFSHRAEIKFQVETGQMPKTGSLTIEQKNKIICWINGGAPNN